MKIMSLNTAFGEQEPELRDFLASRIGEVAIFCLQESTCDVMKKVIDETFPEGEFEFAKTDKKTPANRFGLHTIVQSPLRITRSHTILDDNDPTVGQALATEVELEDGNRLNIVNVHGIPYAIDDKLDTKDRLRQSEQIIRWLGRCSLPTVIGGDFNLSPNTRSITMFTPEYTNLIEEYSIPTTRNRLIWERYPDSIQLFADYIFVSPTLEVTEFVVTDTEASDHLPLTVGITIPSTPSERSSSTPQ